MKLSEKAMKYCIERYNDLMEMVGHEFSTIGTKWSESTEEFNLRDMVAECDYVLSCYYEVGHIFEEMRHGDEYDRKCWRNETARFKRFIKSYEPFIWDMKCSGCHCSKYDN